VRGGAVRISLHLYNDEADVDAVIAALRPGSLGE
jgi:selenocysteine lyase/cysteine desulfurase